MVSLTHWYQIGTQYQPIHKLQVSGNAKRAIVKSVLPTLLLSRVVARRGMSVAAGGVICFDSVSYDGKECRVEVITLACCQ